MRAYSLDLRHKVVNAVLRGIPKAQAAHAFGIGISTVRRYVDTAQKGEDLAPRRPSGKKRKLDEVRMRLLAQDLKEHPTATLSRRREYLARVAGVRVSESTISRAIKRLGWSRKKRSVGAAERNEFLRAAWEAMVVGRTQAGRIVFVDECSTNISLSPLYAYSPKGQRQRARCKVPRNYGPNVTLLTSMSAGGMGPCLAVEGATTRVVFEVYVEEVLGPSLRPGQIVVMDNLSSHKGDQVRELIDERGCELLYLPPYSPDYNPIEEAFAKLKASLRTAAARSHEALVEAMGTALDKITAHDAHGFIEHCGYRTPASRSDRRFRALTGSSLSRPC